MNTVDPQKLAGAGGITIDDVLLSTNGVEIQSEVQLFKILRETRTGEAIVFSVRRDAPTEKSELILFGVEAAVASAAAAERTDEPDGTFVITAPAGPLNVSWRSDPEGAPFVWQIKRPSPLAAVVPPGAKLLSIDGLDVSSCDADAVLAALNERHSDARRLHFAPRQPPALRPPLDADGGGAAMAPLANDDATKAMRHVELDSVSALMPLPESEGARQASLLTGVLGGTRVVVKAAPSEATAAQIIDLAREVALLHALPTHPHLVRLISAAAPSAPRPFAVLELLEGQSLEVELQRATAEAEPLAAALASVRTSVGRRLSRRSSSSAEAAAVARWTVETALDCGVQLCHAVAHLHGGGLKGRCVLHRDLKPANVLLLPSAPLPPDGEPGEQPRFSSRRFTLKLLDLGLAKVLPPRAVDGGSDAHRCMTAETGTVRYMAPEVATGRPYGAPADVFSLSLVLWSAVALRTPFSGLVTA